jgi:hypothetical protein
MFEATRQFPHVLLAQRQKSQVGPPENQATTKGLGLAKNNVDAEIPRRFQQSQAHRIGHGGGHQGAGGVGVIDQRAEILHDP